MYEKLIAELREYWNDGTEDLRNQAADAIEELTEELEYTKRQYDLAVNDLEKIGWGEWVPAMERLPEECGRYIVLLKASEDETKRWIEWGLGDDADVVLEMFYDADQKIWKTEVDAYNAILSVVNREHDSCVTHWMPLPPPPIIPAEAEVEK